VIHVRRRKEKLGQGKRRQRKKIQTLLRMLMKRMVSLDEIELDDFLSFLAEQDYAVSLEATMDIGELQGTLREKADALSKLVWEVMNY
jgi:hypothetical protein